MIISSQQVAIHMHKLRNLSIYTTGKYQLKVSLVQGQVKAVPVTVLQKQIGQTQNRSEFDKQQFLSQRFSIKSGDDVQIDQIFIFKLDSPISSNQDESYLVLTIQLICWENQKQKVVAVYTSKINPTATHEYLQIDYYEPAPSQIVGSFHRLPYKFTFKSESIESNMSQFFEKHYKTNYDYLLEKLEKEAFQNYEKLAKYLNTIRKEKIQIAQKQLNFNLFESHFDLCQRDSNLSTSQGSDSSSEGLSTGRKRKKGIFSVSKKFKRQKFESFEKHLQKLSQTAELLWKQLLQTLLSKQGQDFVMKEAINFHNKLKQKVKESITISMSKKDNSSLGQDFSLQNQIVSKLRNQAKSTKQNDVNEQQDFPIVNKDFFTEGGPIIFEEKSSQSTENQPQQILIFLVHGLGACRLDMEKLKAQLRRYHGDEIKIHVSTTNQGRTETDIDLLGLRLASEIDYQLSKLTNIPKICLIGHSLGGLIIRSALPRLQRYQRYFHSFITFSSPHLGYAYSASKIVDAGLWYMNIIKKSTSPSQMAMKDNERLQQTFLYKLSKKVGLNWFKKIVLIGSKQDQYVPYYSARIQKQKESVEDQKENLPKGKVYCEMVDKIFNNVTGTIIRLNVNFFMPQTNLDNLIGRKAHMNFITNTQMVRAFALSAKSYIF